MKKEKKINIFPSINRKTNNRQALSLREAMNKLFDESVWDPFDVLDNSLLESAANWPAIQSFSPKINLSEDEKNIIVNVDLPGVNPDDVDIEVRDDSLIISGKTEEEKEKKEKKFYYYERKSGSFYREISLPSKVDEKKTKAEIKNGVLEIILPKTAKSEGYKIKVK